MNTIEQTTKPGVLDILPGDFVLGAIAHPDDELIIGGVLAEAYKHGANLLALIATNGEGSTSGTREIGAAGNTRLEGSKALSAYGIPREHQFFLGLPDGRLSETPHADELRGNIRDIA